MTDIAWTNDRVRLCELKPWENNPRKMTKRAARRLLESWRDYGQVQLVVIGPDNEVYDGHQRLSALRAAYGDGYEIEVRRASRPLTEEERQRLVVLLHAGAEGQWDWAKLATWDADKLMAWGMDGEHVAQWRADAQRLKDLLVPKATQKEEQVPLQNSWGVQSGQMWALGRHRLLCGDATDEQQVGRLIGDDKPTLWILDPPFDHDYSLFVMPPTIEVAAVWYGTNIYVLSFLASRFKADEWSMSDIVFLGGVRGPVTYATPSQVHQRVSFFKRRGAKGTVADVRHGDLRVFRRKSRESKQLDERLMRAAGILMSDDGRPLSVQVDGGGLLHAQRQGFDFAKPIKELEMALAFISEGEVVFESCAGSGVGLLASHRHGRLWLGCEIDPVAVSLILDRWVAETGQRPEVIGGATEHV